MITTLFLGFVALMAAVVVALSARYLNGRTAFVITAGLFVWLIYVGLLGYFGVVRNAAMRPPGDRLYLCPRPGLSRSQHLGTAIVCWGSRRAGFSALDHSGYAKLPHRRRTVPAPALDRRSRPQNADLRRGERGHLCWSVSAPYRLVVHARAIGDEPCAHLECAGAFLTDERRDSRRVDSPRSVQPDPRRSSQSDDRQVSIHVHSRILRAVGGGAALACRASYRFNYLFKVRTPLQVLEGRLLIPYSPLPHPAVGVFVFPINSLVAQNGLEFPTKWAPPRFGSSLLKPSLM